MKKYSALLLVAAVALFGLTMSVTVYDGASQLAQVSRTSDQNFMTDISRGDDTFSTKTKRDTYLLFNILEDISYLEKGMQKSYITVLKKLLMKYPVVPMLPDTNIFDEQTHKAVKVLQILLGQDPTGRVDQTFLTSLKDHTLFVTDPLTGKDSVSISTASYSDPDTTPSGPSTEGTEEVACIDGCFEEWGDNVSGGGSFSDFVLCVERECLPDAPVDDPITWNNDNGGTCGVCGLPPIPGWPCECPPGDDSDPETNNNNPGSVGGLDPDIFGGTGSTIDDPINLGPGLGAAACSTGIDGYWYQLQIDATVIAIYQSCSEQNSSDNLDNNPSDDDTASGGGGSDGSPGETLDPYADLCTNLFGDFTLTHESIDITGWYHIPDGQYFTATNEQTGTTYYVESGTSGDCQPLPPSMEDLCRNVPGMQADPNPAVSDTGIGAQPIDQETGTAYIVTDPDRGSCDEADIDDSIITESQNVLDLECINTLNHESKISNPLPPLREIMLSEIPSTTTYAFEGLVPPNNGPGPFINTMTQIYSGAIPTEIGNIVIINKETWKNLGTLFWDEIIDLSFRQAQPDPLIQELVAIAEPNTNQKRKYVFDEMFNLDHTTPSDKDTIAVLLEEESEGSLVEHTLLVNGAIYINVSEEDYVVPNDEELSQQIYKYALEQEILSQSELLSRLISRLFSSLDVSLEDSALDAFSLSHFRNPILGEGLLTLSEIEEYMERENVENVLSPADYSVDPQAYTVFGSFTEDDTEDSVFSRLHATPLSMIATFYMELIQELYNEKRDSYFEELRQLDINSPDISDDSVPFYVRYTNERLPEPDNIWQHDYLAFETSEYIIESRNQIRMMTHALMDTSLYEYLPDDYKAYIAELNSEYGPTNPENILNGGFIELIPSIPQNIPNFEMSFYDLYDYTNPDTGRITHTEEGGRVGIFKRIGTFFKSIFTRNKSTNNQTNIAMQSSAQSLSAYSECSTAVISSGLTPLQQDFLDALLFYYYAPTSSGFSQFAMDVDQCITDPTDYVSCGAETVENAQAYLWFEFFAANYPGDLGEAPCNECFNDIQWNYDMSGLDDALNECIAEGYQPSPNLDSNLLLFQMCGRAFMDAQEGFFQDMVNQCNHLCSG